jgi:hypothetical protein
MSCNNKTKNKCGSKNYASCIAYETPTPSFSSLYENTCTDIEETIEDIYTLIGGIKNEISVSSVANDCITFTNPKTINSVISQMYSKICSLEDIIATQSTTLSTQAAQILALQNNICN